jgi:hypothetical protein
MSINTSPLSSGQVHSHPVAASNKQPLPPLPPLETKKSEEHSFAWPPKKVKQQLAYSVQQFKQFIDDLKSETTDEDTRNFLERFEEKLATMTKFNKNEVTEYLNWGNDFYQHELKDHAEIPLFFKNEFKQWLQLLRLTRSWNQVQKTLEAPIKKAYQGQVLDELFSQDATNQEQQLGQIFINLYQADQPQYLQQRLQTADKLCAHLVKNQRLDEKQLQALQNLLQELHGIADPLVSSSLAGRVSQSIPSSKWTSWKEFFSSIFAAIQEIFRRLTWTEKSLELSDYGLTEHCDFNEELVVREELFMQNAMGDHNSYLHQITTENESFIIHRSGAIDALEGSTHLAKLKKEIMEEWEEQIQASSFEEFHTLAMDYLQQHWSVQLYHALQKVEKHQSTLDDQMLQLIAQQVKAHSADIVDPSRMTLPRLTRTIQLTQLNLLDPHKEGHPMLEMAALFHRFNGKEIVFEDVAAPSLDGETIFLPLSLLIDIKTGKSIVHPDIEEPFTLSCTFFNTSTQKLTANQRKQTIINQSALQETQNNLEAIQAFIEKHPKKKSLLKISLVELMHRFKQIEERVNQGETGYAIAQEITLLQADMQGMIGINCSDGTSRTSHLIGKLVAYFIEREIDQRDDLSQKEKQALKRKLI